MGLRMSKTANKEPKTPRPPEWVSIEPQGPSSKPGAVNPLEAQAGSCVVKVSAGFDRGLFIEVCQALLKL